MTNDELKELLKDKSEEWRKGFFSAVNLNNETKSAFLRMFIGESVIVSEGDDESLKTVRGNEDS